MAPKLSNQLIVSWVPTLDKGVIIHVTTIQHTESGHINQKTKHSQPSAKCVDSGVEQLADSQIGSCTDHGYTRTEANTIQKMDYDIKIHAIVEVQACWLQFLRKSDDLSFRADVS